MANSDEKVSKFVQAITEYAQEQSEKIHKEVEDFKSERLQQAEKEVLADTYQLIQKERDGLRSDLSREISRRDMAARKKLLSRRQEMTASIFEDAVEQLNAFTASPAYAEKLKKSLAEMAAILPAEGTVYYLAEKDAALLDVLSPCCPAGSRLETADDIRIGGLRGENAATGMIADDTLDTRLELQHEWFTKHSGLTVE